MKFYSVEIENFNFINSLCRQNHAKDMELSRKLYQIVQSVSLRLARNGSQLMMIEMNEEIRMAARRHHRLSHFIVASSLVTATAIIVLQVN